jgi:hypothetical protein
VNEGKDSVILLISFFHTLKGANRIDHEIENPSIKAETRNFNLTFKFCKEPNLLTIRSKVKVLSSNGRVLLIRPLEINLYPKEMYQASGQTSPSVLILQKYTPYEIPFSGYDPSHYSMLKPTQSEREFANLEWGNALAKTKGTLSKANSLQRQISLKMYDFQGTPSDSMAIPALEQYKRVLAGKDKLWCTNWIDIFSYAASCFDLPIRRIALNNVFDESSKSLIVSLAEGHSVIEVFDDLSGKWVLIDPVYGLLSSKFCGMKLNTKDMITMVNIPSYRRRIRLKLFDAHLNKDVNVKLINKKGVDAFYNIYKANQEIEYFKNFSN